MNRTLIKIFIPICIIFSGCSSKNHQEQQEVISDSIKILNFYNYNEFLTVKDQIDTYKNLEYLHLWTPKNGIMEARPTDSLIYWFSNTSIKYLSIASDTFRFPNNCIKDTTIQSLAVICFNFDYNRCSFDMFEKITELFFTSPFL